MSINKETLRDFVAERVKYLRLKSNLSQESLSIKANLEPKYINKLENRKYNFSIDTLDKVIIALDISYEEFFDFKFPNWSEEIESLVDSISALPKEKQEQIIKGLLLMFSSLGT